MGIAEVSLTWDQIKLLLEEADIVGVDTETNGQEIRDGRGYAIGISFAVERADIYYTCYLPFRHETAEGFTYDIGENEDATVLADVRDFFERFSGWVVFHNAKFDLVSLQTLGINYKGKFYCTLVISHLINENLYSYKLGDVAKEFVGPEEEKFDTPEFRALVTAFGWAGVPIPSMKKYAAHDASLALAIMLGLMDQFKKEIPETYWQHKQDFIRVIIKMESRGIRIDTELCERMTIIGDTTMASLTDTIGGNLGSPIFLKEILIDRLKLPIVRTSNKTGKASFNKLAMEEYDVLLAESTDPTARYVVEYRGWQKSVSSNYLPYVTLLSPDGRLRPNYNFHKTLTCRLSCEKPNLQQIPRKGVNPWNGKMKKAFIPDPGYTLIEFDYAQLELRLGTAYAKERKLIRAFQEGRDIFTEMAGSIGLPRQQTKTFVYSTQYGAGAGKISLALGITLNRAFKIRDNYKRAYPGFTKVSQVAAHNAKHHGRVKYWSGRYRHFSNFDRKYKAYKAFNSIIQGGAADIVEKVMVRLSNEIDSDDARMLLQVHDSVVWEIKTDLVDQYAPKIKAIMEDVKPDFGVKFAVSVHEWGE